MSAKQTDTGAKPDTYLASDVGIGVATRPPSVSPVEEALQVLVHVKAHRVMDDGEELISRPLADPLLPHACMSVRTALLACAPSRLTLSISMPFAWMTIKVPMRLTEPVRIATLSMSKGRSSGGSKVK